jgi:multimeric flavodoxin WrbA
MTHILGIGGAPRVARSPSCKLLERALEAAKGLNATTSLTLLTNELLDDKSSVKALQDAIKKCDGLIIATPVHWYNVSVLIKRLLDEVFEDFDEEELDGKPFGVIATCNEDGANQALASIVMPLNGYGLLLPPYCALIHNLTIVSVLEKLDLKRRKWFEWQDKDVEHIGKEVTEYARQ